MAKKTAQQWRDYRARRKAQEKPLASDKREATFYAHYRRKRNADGKPLPDGASRRNATREFIAWDGEGITESEEHHGLFPSQWLTAVRARADELRAQGVPHVRARKQAVAEYEPKRAKPAAHRYIMLCNSRGATLEGDSITAEQAFPFLLDEASKYSNAVHVMFGGSYDAVMLLKDLPKKIIHAIYKNETNKAVHVQIGKRMYALWYRQRKYLKIARFANAKRKFTIDDLCRQWKPDYDARITLWDVFGFFQQTFVEALRAYDIEADIAHIDAMKKQRSVFTDAQRPQMRAYCIAECEALESLTGRLAEYLTQAKLRPPRFDGAGAVAAALLRREGVKDHIQPEPKELALPIARAYFGGRIELLRLGRAHGTLYGYDIASAYPSAATGLPSLVAAWEPCCIDSLSGLALARVWWQFPEGLSWYPLPYRNPTGTIVFGSQGEGWYWAPEVEAARAFAAQMGGEVRVYEAQRARPYTDDLPFGFIPELFRARQEYKDQGIGAEKAIKLGLNSLYGKTAQQVGAKDGKFPPYFALSWAGYITSATRARLCEAALLAPDAIVAFMTDGILSTRALPMETHVPTERTPHPALGQWERNEIDPRDGVFVQAGVYWLDEWQKKKECFDWKPRYRGFDKESMATPHIALQAWENKRAEVPVMCSRFITFGSALAHDDAWAWRGTWRRAPRSLNLRGGSPKRLPWDGRGDPTAGLLPLRPRPNDYYESSRALSTPFASITLADAIDGVAARIFTDEVDESGL
jgi:hypothetical protein